MKVIPVKMGPQKHSDRLVFTKNAGPDAPKLMDSFKKAMDEYQAKNPRCTARECRRAAEKATGKTLMCVSVAEKMKKANQNNSIQGE